MSLLYASDKLNGNLNHQHSPLKSTNYKINSASSNMLNEPATNGNAPNNTNINVANRNTIYKGWILTLQDGSSTSTNLKWIPKYAVCNRLEKTIVLYDYEVSNQLACSPFNPKNFTHPNSSASLVDPSQVTFLKMDNSVKRDQFIAHWRNKSDNFDPNIDSNTKYLVNDMTGIAKSTSISNRLSNIFHMSSREVPEQQASFDKEGGDSGNDIENGNHESRGNGNNLATSTTPFRFAGLFSKKNKQEKSKHSSLKRAKSGIQLERKKPTILTNNSGNNSNNMSVTDANDRINQTSGFTDFTNYDNRLGLPSPMRPSRSHESLASPMKPSSAIQDHQPSNFTKSSSIKSKLKLLGTQTPSSKSIRLNAQAAKKSFQNSKETIVKLNINPSVAGKEPVGVHSVHQSLFSEENCFEVKCLNSSMTVMGSSTIESSSFETDFSEDDDYTDYEYANDEYQQKQFRNSRYRNNTKSQRASSLIQYQPIPKSTISTETFSSRYFLCRNSEERDKWIQCLKSVTDPEIQSERRHAENSLQVWLLEAKGNLISSKPTKKYFCEVFLNNMLYSRTCCKEKKDILFWGESFDFNNVNCQSLRVELYQETAIKSKKSKKDKENNLNNLNSKEIHTHLSNQTLLGYVNIPVSSIEGGQPVEKWYRLEPPSSLSASTNQLDEISIPPQQSSTDNNEQETLVASTTGSQAVVSQSAASLTTTQNFSKDSISIRIKAKYQSVDILPQQCYRRLIEYVRENYLSLMITLEPQLNVRVKDDLANSLVQIAHKLCIQTTFLSDLVLAEILQLEDSSLTFRGNSLATKAMEFYMKLVGDSYLKQTLSDCVRSIIDTSHDLEIDPSKVANQSFLQANREELVQILHLVCGRVFNSTVNFPIEMKFVFAELRAKCLENGKTDEMCDILISASIFLRFICPAILSPNLFNLTQEYPQEKAARKLTLVAKTLQTIANFSKFGGKESYMSFDKMNQFVDEHTILMREFLRKISTITDDDLEEQSRKANKTMDNSGKSYKQNLPIVTLTPQSPETPRRAMQTLMNLEFNQQDEPDFELELIDLSKQLSILHSLLNTIVAGMDDTTRAKITDELHGILGEITELKKNGNFNNLMSVDSQNVHQNKLYSYENRLHSVMKNQMTQSSPSTPPTEMGDSQGYASQVNVSGVNENNIAVASLTQQKLEADISLLKSKLRETEVTLKKEQTEKYLIEYKLKQQQQDNDLQMRSIINRLIKVEEELRKEQTEMHKLLKAKQDLIDIQKKRIEHLTNRSGLQTTNSNSTKSINTIHQKSIFQQLNGSAHITNNLIDSNSNSSSSNSTQKLNQFSVSPDEQQQIQQSQQLPKDVWAIKQQQQQRDLAPGQIAASPASSSSSMTQFCKYLATNTLLQPTPSGLVDLSNFNKQSKRKSSYHQGSLNTELSKSNQRMLSPTPPPHTHSGQGNGNANDATSSSTSSSSSALSTSSSLNHLNQNQATNLSSNFNFFRTSEL